ncbi:MAG: hypothetical protein LBE31_07730 [Deltaproteobacteria bacterium]|jgi:hypothetical protein|nr:hypothetical protein [Deltaproteobacteria bacterium]
MSDILIKPLATLAIGSVPFATTDEALDLMASNLDIPAHPQMVALTPWEDMLLSATFGLPAIKIDPNNNIIVAASGREEAMAEFYEKYYNNDLSFLDLDERSSCGFNAFMARAKSDPDFGRVALKSQIVGPLTFGQSVKVEGGNNLVDDPALLEIASLAMGGRAARVALQFRELGRNPVVFLDEPGLTGYGSAFSTLTPQTVLSALGAAVTAAKAQGPVLVGCHVCGNTDWGLLTKAGLDIINFDAFEFLEAVCLYPEPIEAFLEGGGVLAWGVVPTRDFDESITVDRLTSIVREGWRVLASKGVNLRLLKERTWLTSACGLGSLTTLQAKGILEILPKVSLELAKDLN